MEVHHHAHTDRKKWTHYFWEFLMLFLAVFCGFLAENIREHKIEQHRAKDFAKSLVQDLQNDTTAINVQNKSSEIYISIADSLLRLSQSKLEGQPAAKFSFIPGLCTGQYPFPGIGPPLNKLRTQAASVILKIINYWKN